LEAVVADSVVVVGSAVLVEVVRVVAGLAVAGSMRGHHGPK
jgi:hypothetical protein